MFWEKQAGNLSDLRSDRFLAPDEWYSVRIKGIEDEADAGGQSQDDEYPPYNNRQALLFHVQLQISTPELGTMGIKLLE